MSWDWQPTQTTLRNLLALARHEFRETLRERAGWGGIAVACAVAFADSALRPLSPLVAGVRASSFDAGVVLTFIAILLLAGVARRDQTTRAEEVVTARPYRGHLLVAARLLGNLGVVLFAYVLVIASALAAPLLLVGRLPPVLTAVHAFERGAPPLIFIVAVTYCAVFVARNMLAGAAVAVYGVLVLAWGDYLARIFSFTLSQNQATYLLLAGASALGAMAWGRRLQRVPDPPLLRRALPLGALGLAVVGLGGGAWRVAHSHDKPLHSDPLALAMARQSIEANPRLPGFWLKDQHGRDFRLSSTNGRVLVLAVWSPHVPESVPVLEALQRVHRELQGSPVSCVAVCLADDHAISADLAAEGRYRFPMVTDPGTHFTSGSGGPNSSGVEDCSPLAEAYHVTSLPTVLVADAGRRLTAELSSREATTAEAIAAAAKQALAIRPPPS